MDCGMVPRRSNFRYKSALILLQNEKNQKVFDPIITNSQPIC